MTMAKHMLSKTNDDLTIKDPQEKYVILGDIVDRGPASLPSLLFFLALNLKSPDNFFLARGNHEDRGVFSTYGLTYEINALFASSLDQGEKNEKGINIISKISHLCRLLPVAIYAVKGDNKFDMYMHGCVDKGDNSLEIKTFLKKCQDEKKPTKRVYHSDKSSENLLMWGDSGLSKEKEPYGEIDGNRGVVEEEDINEFLEKIKPFEIDTINCAHQHGGSYGKTILYFLPNQFHFNYSVQNTKILRHGLCPCCASAQPNKNDEFPGFIGYSTIVHDSNGKSSVIRLANNEIQGERGINNFVEIYFRHIKEHLNESDIFTNKGKIQIFSYLFDSFKALYKKSISEATDDELKAFLIHYADAKNQYVAFEFKGREIIGRYIPDLEWKFLINIDCSTEQYNLELCHASLPSEKLVKHLYSKIERQKKIIEENEGVKSMLNLTIKDTQGELQSTKDLLKKSEESNKILSTGLKYSQEKANFSQEQLIEEQKNLGDIKTQLDDIKKKHKTIKEQHEKKTRIIIGGTCVISFLLFLVLKQAYPHFFSWDYWKNSNNKNLFPNN